MKKTEITFTGKEQENMGDYGEGEKAKAHVVNGLDKAAIRDLKKFAKNGKCELGNLIEVMACPGGCLGGSNTINAYKQANKQLTGYVEQSKDIKEILK